MDKKKISVIIEIIIFFGILGAITLAYYFSGSKEIEEDVTEVGIIKVNDSNFEEVVLKSTEPVVVEFSSNMCPPCLTMIPTLVSIAKNNENVKVVTLNTSDSDTKETAEKYNVEATPTILIFKDGLMTRTFIGATSEETIMQELN